MVRIAYSKRYNGEVMTRRPKQPQSRLGEHLRSLRLAAGHTQASLAEAAEVTQANLSRIERGGHHLTQRTSIASLSGGLGCLPCRVMGWHCAT
ncbi:MAG: hypothetical protein AMJ46_12455 [Latescibacteria bacterium DG_63]|nr:MAG: hypothetical protein AMJ46_12455 [Latescibacteria bacterium DG_63]